MYYIVIFIGNSMICSDIWHNISKLLYVISQAVRQVILRQFWNITSGIFAKYHVQIMLLFVYTTTRKRFVIFTCGYFKLSWNTTALSQSNWSNFSCNSIKLEICSQQRSLSLVTSRSHDIQQWNCFPPNLWACNTNLWRQRVTVHRVTYRRCCEVYDY